MAAWESERVIRDVEVRPFDISKIPSSGTQIADLVAGNPLRASE
jgi:hypothetical protein